MSAFDARPGYRNDPNLVEACRRLEWRVRELEALRRELLAENARLRRELRS